MALGMVMALLLTTARRRYGTGGLWIAAGALALLIALLPVLRPHPWWEPWHQWGVLTWQRGEWTVSSQLGAGLIGLLTGAGIVQTLDRPGHPSRAPLLAAISIILGFGVQLIILR